MSDRPTRPGSNSADAPRRSVPPVLPGYGPAKYRSNSTPIPRPAQTRPTRPSNTRTQPAPRPTAAPQPKSTPVPSPPPWPVGQRTAAPVSSTPPEPPPSNPQPPTSPPPQPTTTEAPSTPSTATVDSQKSCPPKPQSVSLIPAFVDTAMADNLQVRNRVLLRLMGHPIVLGPAVLGFTAATWFWAMNGRAAWGAFAAIAGVLAACGAYVTRVILDRGRTVHTVVAEQELQKRAAWESRLDALDRRLVQADQDPRPETSLRDMRALLRAFEEFAGQCGPDHLAAVLDVRSRVFQLFEQSVGALERTMQLNATARQLHLPDARKPILDERERLIADIQAGIAKLGSTLVGLQRLGAGDQARSELARLRDGLDESLQLAERVEERLNSLLQDNSLAAAEEYLRTDTPKT